MNIIFIVLGAVLVIVTLVTRLQMIGKNIQIKNLESFKKEATETSKNNKDLVSKLETENLAYSTTIDNNTKKILKRMLINGIISSVLQHVSNNIWKYVQIDSTNMLDKAKTYNITLTPSIIGTELRALPIAKDKSVPIIYLNFQEILSSVDPVKIEDLLLYLEQQDIDQLQQINDILVKNIKKFNTLNVEK